MNEMNLQLQHFLKNATVKGPIIEGNGDVVATFTVNNTPSAASWI